MEKVIALCGKSKKGKTTTLNKLCSSLQNCEEKQKENYGGAEDRLYLSTDYGKRIAIATAGDDPKAIMIAIIFSIINDRDILIVAYSYSRKNNFPDKTIKDNIIEALENLSEDNENNETIDDKWCKHYEKEGEKDDDTRELLKKIIDEPDKSSKEGRKKIKEKAIELKTSIENKHEEDLITYINIGNKAEYKPINEIRIERIKSSINKKA